MDGGLKILHFLTSADHGENIMKGEEFNENASFKVDDGNRASFRGLKCGEQIEYHIPKHNRMSCQKGDAIPAA